MNAMLSKLGTLGIGIVLARVLGPESFGTFSIALVALVAVLSFNELGVSLAIVRWPGDPSRIVPTVNTISVGSSALFCAAAYFAAPHFTSAMGDPSATVVVQVLILSVLINGIVASPAALLQREFREKTRLGIDQVNVWVGAVLSLVLAFAGMGAMALAVGRLVGSLISGAMFLAKSPLPYRFGLDPAHFGHLLRFGLPLAGTSIVFFVVGYADQLSAGILLGPIALAFYTMAFNLSNWPVSIFAQPLRRVAPAVLSSVQQDKEAMHSSLVSIIAVVAAAALPGVFFLAGVATPLVRFVYGSDWVPAAAALAWLVVAAMCKIFSDLSYDYLVVRGKSGRILMIQTGSMLILIPVLVAGATWYGLPGLAGAQAMVAALVVLPLYFWCLSREGISLRGIFYATWVSLLASLAVGGASLTVALWLPGDFLMLLFAGVLTAAVTGLLLFLRRSDLGTLRRIGRSTPAKPVEMLAKGSAG
ncbi:oligosaccharide flippase family protein [Pseudarthrobacter defluvii]|uniref:oligosaccharide flippase family protein n=1 Tax=Pseudarthrobacter defluvii TaxID=410837 RepID=UPI0027D784BC|nr:oligosaccharide flippase family protein [Pseudarthrobacter defluvii]